MLPVILSRRNFRRKPSGPRALAAALFLLAGAAFCASPIDLEFNDAADRYFQPLLAAEIISQNVPGKIAENYRKKDFRSALVDLERLIRLHLPDNREDTYLFMAAECYFQLKLLEPAEKNYSAIIKYYPGTPHKPEALFRSIQIYNARKSLSALASAYDRLKKSFPDHPLLAGASYLYAQSLIESRRYDQAAEILASISPASPFSTPGKYLYALCLLWQGDAEGAVDSLNALAVASGSRETAAECRLTAGRLLHRQGSFDEALAAYSAIPKSSDRYPLATLKKAMVFLSREDYAEAITQARPVLENKDLFFEASLILLDAYWGLQDSTNAALVRSRLTLQAKLTRMMILTREEGLLTDRLKREWATFTNQPVPENLAQEKAAVERHNITVQVKLDRINQDLTDIYSLLSKYRSFDEPLSTGGIREKQLLELMERKHQETEALIKSLARPEPLTPGLSPDDSPTAGLSAKRRKKSIDSLMTVKAGLEELVGSLYELNQALMKENTEKSTVQPKFIDVGMILYERLKSRYQNANKNIRMYTNRRDSLIVQQKMIK